MLSKLKYIYLISWLALVFAPFMLGEKTFLLLQKLLIGIQAHNYLYLKFTVNLFLLSYLILSFFLLYKYKEFERLPDERSGFLRYFASISRSAIPLWLLIILFTKVALIPSGLLYAEKRMLPTLQGGDRVWATPIIYMSSSPKRGDIVSWIGKDGRNRFNRIIGLPNETLEINNKGQLLIDNKLLPERYIDKNAKSIRKSIPTHTLAYQEYEVARDNPTPGDELSFRIKREAILGKIFFRYNPLSRIGFLPDVNYTPIVVNIDGKSSKKIPVNKNIADTKVDDKKTVSSSWLVKGILYGLIGLLGILYLLIMFHPKVYLKFKVWILSITVGLLIYIFVIGPYIIAQLSSSTKLAVLISWSLSLLFTVIISVKSNLAPKKTHTVVLMVISKVIFCIPLMPFILLGIIYEISNQPSKVDTKIKNEIPTQPSSNSFQEAIDSHQYESFDKTISEIHKDVKKN